MAKNTKKQDGSSPPDVDQVKRRILILEYQELNETIRNRGRQFAIIQSILISTSLVAVTFALKCFEDVGKPATVGILILANILVVIAYIMYYTTRKLDKIFFQRLEDIEKHHLIEMEGHHKLYEEKIKCTWWYLIRRYAWPIIFLALIIFYIFAFFIIQLL